MTGTFYHASNIAGLSQLEPLSKQHGGDKRVCYFTQNKTYALFYLRDMDINHVTCGVDDNGVVVYHEQFPNQLEVLYKGRSGSVYHCDDRDITKGRTDGVWISTVPVLVSAEEKIGDVYASIIEAEWLDKVRVIRYETLSDEKKTEITEMMKKSILKNNLLKSDSAKAVFMRTSFPDSWKRALEENENEHQNDCHRP